LGGKRRGNRANDGERGSRGKKVGRGKVLREETDMYTKGPPGDWKKQTISQGKT